MSLSTSGDNALFLSYARADESDGGFVSTLYEKLETAGYSTWWDQVDMPSRGLAFMHEIRRAIDGARRVLIVLGPRAAESEYVRAEWQHALASSKIVIPLLRVGRPDTVPPELRSLHFVDVRAGRPFAEAWGSSCASLVLRIRSSASCGGAFLSSPRTIVRGSTSHGTWPRDC